MTSVPLTLIDATGAGPPGARTPPRPTCFATGGPMPSPLATTRGSPGTDTSPPGRRDDTPRQAVPFPGADLMSTSTHVASRPGSRGRFRGRPSSPGDRRARAKCAGVDGRTSRGGRPRWRMPGARECDRQPTRADTRRDARGALCQSGGTARPRCPPVQDGGPPAGRPDRDLSPKHEQGALTLGRDEHTMVAATASVGGMTLPDPRLPKTVPVTAGSGADSPKRMRDRRG